MNKIQMVLAVGQETQEVKTLLDKIYNNISSHFDNFVAGVINIIINILVACVIYFIGKKLIKLLIKFLNRVFKRSKVDESVSKFLVSLVRAICYIMLVIVLLVVIGIKAATMTAAVAAVVGSAGLTIGLALQGSLQNFSGGVLILLLKPFKIGDYIIVENYEGTVETIDIFYTKLLTIDNRVVILPNGTLSNTNITNVTKEDIRRLDLSVSVSYSEDIGRVKALLSEIANSKEAVMKDHDINVYVSEFEASSILMGIRVWCKTDDYWPLRWNMLESIKNVFDQHGIEIPFNQLDIHITDHVTEK